VRHVVIGVAQRQPESFPEDIREQATSLFLETRTPCSRRRTGRGFAKIAGSGVSALLADRSARESILPQFQEHSGWTNGCAVRIEDEESFTGITEGLDAQDSYKCAHRRDCEPSFRSVRRSKSQ